MRNDFLRRFGNFIRVVGDVVGLVGLLGCKVFSPAQDYAKTPTFTRPAYIEPSFDEKISSFAKARIHEASAGH